jgi:hypothetical protein
MVTSFGPGPHDQTASPSSIHHGTRSVGTVERYLDSQLAETRRGDYQAAVSTVAAAPVALNLWTINLK